LSIALSAMLAVSLLTVGLLMAGLLMAGLSTPAAAQNSESYLVLVVNQKRIQTEAAAAQAIAREEQARKEALRAAFDQERATLQARERELIELRETMAKDDFDAVVDEFQDDVRSLRGRMDKGRADMRRALSEAKEILARALQKVLAELMKEHGALIIIDETNAIAHASALNITDKAIARLDAALPFILIPPTGPAPLSQP
jgi:Skp family chaperone for outer membrane proteins